MINGMKKLFRITFNGHYSVSYGWDDGWNVCSVHSCALDWNVARFTVFDRDYECVIDEEFVDRWGGYVDSLRDNAGSRSADVYVFADDADSAKSKAYDVIMRFRPPTAFYG